MNKLCLGILLFSSSIFAFDYITNFPEGRYDGAGHWSDSLGAFEEYNSYIIFDRYSMHIDYHYSDFLHNFDFDFVFLVDGFFDVFFHGIQVGDGFCMTHQCTYSLLIDGLAINETLTFLDDRILKFGYKFIGDRLIRWEEELLPEVSDLLPDNEERQEQI